MHTCNHWHSLSLLPCTEISFPCAPCRYDSLSTLCDRRLYHRLEVKWNHVRHFGSRKFGRSSLMEGNGFDPWLSVLTCARIFVSLVKRLNMDLQAWRSCEFLHKERKKTGIYCRWQKDDLDGYEPSLHPNTVVNDLKTVSTHVCYSNTAH